MIKVDENEPIGELEAKFPYRDVRIKKGVDVKEFYDLEAEIGRGKFGTVYLCREKATHLSLAAKFVGIQRRQDRKNVEREVEIMRTLQHPRLIQLYDAFECNNTMVVVLELIEGGELFERVIGDDFILTEKACTIFMRQICEGVAFIHKNNIIHLDLKPENILCLTKTGNRIKIIDFGLARHYEPGNKLQVLFGTPEFVAPEVVNFEQISPATDMWSVGVICYVLLSGLSPFMGDTDVETMSNVTLGRYDFDDDSFDNISKNAKDFISNLLLKDKEARLTAEMCLQHPWLKKKTPPPPPNLITAKENLKVFVDNYQNSNAIVNHDVERLINPKPPAISAVELITASDKKFMNRDITKSFSNISNENILPPVRLHDLFATNNNVTPVVNDNEVDDSCLPSTNDQMLNIVNANVSSMPPPPPLDSVPTIPNVSFVPNSLIKQEFENNNTPVDSELKVEEETRNDHVVNVPLADISRRIVPMQEVPVAPLPFISKSLPAAAAMIDDNMVDQLKPLHIPLIPTLPITQLSDEPMIPHLPVVASVLGLPIAESANIAKTPVDIAHSPRKRGSIDVLSLIYKRGSIDVDSLSRRGSHESIQTTSPLPSTSSLLPENDLNKHNEPKLPVAVRLSTELPFVGKQPDIGIVETPRLVVPEPPSILSFQTIPISKPTPPLIASPPPTAQEIPILASLPKLPDVFLPPLPEIETPDLPSEQPFVKPTSVQNTVISVSPPNLLKGLNSKPSEFPTQSFRSDEIQSKPHSPVTEPLRSSPISVTPTRRESPLQKTLDDIPKISSEILSSFTKMPSLTRSTSYETSMSKTLIESRKTVNYLESTRSSYERGRSPRDLVEHSSFDYSGSFSKSQSSTLGRRNIEEKSAFSPVSRTTFTSRKRSEDRETEIDASRHSLKADLEKKRSEVDALGFKQRLRSTAPWFSERKTESEPSIEKRSSDMSDLLAENLGPLERSPWAREIRKISAKLVEMSKEQTARKQQEENHVAEMNEKSARRQKFKLSVLNRDVVFGAAREFYVGGEVPIVGSSSKDNSSKQTTQSTQSYPSSSTPKRKITPTFSGKSK